MTKTLLAVAALGLAAALSGCGSGVLGGGSTPTSTVADPQDQMLKFTQCMRQHGVQMDDPKPGGGITMHADASNRAKIDAAQKACQKYSPERESGPRSSADLDHDLKMAQCLRRNGVDAEDPAPGQGLRIRVQKQNEQKTDKAMQTCQREVGPPPSRKDG